MSIDSSFNEELEQFEDMLTERTDEAVHDFLRACQNELDSRAQKDLLQAKTTLQKISQQQLLEMLGDLGIELPADKKPRARKSRVVPFCYKEFSTNDGKYFVPKYYNTATRESVVGSQAVFLKGLSPEQKLQQFGTVQQLQAGTLALADLVELGLVYTMQDGACVQATLDMLPVLGTATVPDKPAKKVAKRQPEVEVAA